MNSTDKTRIYILGAGCSAGNGYPVAKSFVSELELFGKRLNDQAARIKECVEETVALMRQHNVATIDDLAVRIHTGCFDASSAQSNFSSVSLREQRIERAKIATAAMLLSKERAARQGGLQNYHNFLYEIMPGGSSWERKLEQTNWHVLTFNYDRLFEIALSDRLEPAFGRQFGLYSKGILNAGLNLGPEVQFADERFSFLKLHGSIGARVQPEFGSITYQPFDEEGFAVEQITDNRFFSDPKPHNRIPACPLLIFPFEKQHVQAGGRHSYYEKYISAVWSRARKLIANASEIRIVGYSFQTIDKDSLLSLLAEARHCERGIIQNLPGEAENIRTMLKSLHPDVRIPWEAYPLAF